MQPLHRIKEVMKQQGVSQKELAERLGVSKPAISMQLSATSITLQRIYEIAEVLGVSPHELLSVPMPDATHNCPHCGHPIRVELH